MPEFEYKVCCIGAGEFKRARVPLPLSSSFPYSLPSLRNLRDGDAVMRRTAFGQQDAA
jgi:hypothetical protein